MISWNLTFPGVFSRPSRSIKSFQQSQTYGCMVCSLFLFTIENSCWECPKTLSSMVIYAFVRISGGISSMAAHVSTFGWHSKFKQWNPAFTHQKIETSQQTALSASGGSPGQILGFMCPSLMVRSNMVSMRSFIRSNTCSLIQSWSERPKHW